jgi:predicted phage tail protein
VKTKVILEGPMGKRFGRVWEFVEINSPSEALKMVDCNRPGVMNWIRENLRKYPNYKVVCTYEGGRKELLDTESYQLQGKIEIIRFVPLIAGAAAGVRFVIGVIMFAVGVYTGNAYLMSAGVSLMVGSVVEWLSPKPKKPDDSAREDKTSYYFDGPVNTDMQGVPVPLIYGRILCGSHAISAAVTIDQLM